MWRIALACGASIAPAAGLRSWRPFLSHRPGLALLGIAVGLSSRVEVPARELQIVRLPLAVLLGGLLVWMQRTKRQ